jgi:hypothetical protein
MIGPGIRKNAKVSAEPGFSSEKNGTFAHFELIP